MFAVPKPEKCTKQGMHLLSYYEDVDQLYERLVSVWCELDQSVVNHAIIIIIYLYKKVDTTQPNMIKWIKKAEC